MIESAGSRGIAGSAFGNAKGDVGVTGTPIRVSRVSQADTPTTRLYHSEREIGHPCAQSCIQERHDGRCPKN